MRSERKNDTAILERLQAIGIDVAIIKTKSEAVEDHLRTLNGKVVSHESRLQLLDGVATTNQLNIENLKVKEKDTDNFWKRNWEKMFWFGLASTWTYFNIHK